MGIIHILLMVSVVIAVLFLFIFLFMVRGGQYDDTYTPSVRMLFEDEVVNKEEKHIKKKN